MFFKSILATATLFAAVSAQINLELPTNIIAGVQVGDDTCPVNNAGDINANVFAVVNLVEQVTVSIDAPAGLPLPADIITINGDDTATINIGATVCLCVQAGVDTSLTPQQTADIDAEAVAQVQGLLLADVAGNAADTALVNNLIANGLTLDVVPIIAATTDCTCAANEIPGCTNGKCTCTPCPLAGQVYNAATGQCQLSASQITRAKRTTTARQSKNFY